MDFSTIIFLLWQKRYNILVLLFSKMRLANFNKTVLMLLPLPLVSLRCHLPPNCHLLPHCDPAHPGGHLHHDYVDYYGHAHHAHTESHGHAGYVHDGGNLPSACKHSIVLH